MASCTVDVLRGGAAFRVDCCLVQGRRALIDLQKRCAAMAYCGAKKLCDEDSKGSTISTLSRAGELNRRSLYSPMRGLVPVASSVGALWSLSIEVSQLRSEIRLLAGTEAMHARDKGYERTDKKRLEVRT